MGKFWFLTTSGLVMLGLAWIMPPSSESADEPPPSEKKKDEAAKKDAPGPEGDLNRAYELLRRIKADAGQPGRADDRLRGWTDRAVGFYRRGVAAYEAGDRRRAHELGVAAHDLARAVDHTRAASRFDQADPDLPPPPRGAGPAIDATGARRDLRHAYDRIGEMDDEDGPDALFYRDAARDLYTAARRDAEDGRAERAAELAHAAEALTHVPEHLAHAEHDAPEPPKGEPRPKPKAKRKADDPDPKTKAKRKADDHEPKTKRYEPPADDDALPPPLAPRG